VLGLLTNIAELRAQSVLPRQPLDVVLIGAEISAPARQYAEALLVELRESLEAQAIFVRDDFRHWDVTDALSNTDLIRAFTQATTNTNKSLLIVANFNGFLESERKRDKAEPQIAELFRYASGESSVAIWIEPDMNRATAQGGLFDRMRVLIGSSWRRFARIINRGETQAPIARCAAKFRLPLRPTDCANVRLAVMRIDLVRS
jgi:hypothetical protein